MRRLRDLCTPGSPCTAALVFLGVFVFSGASRVATSYDSRWSVFIALNLWRHQHTWLDEFDAQMRETNYYAIECVDSAGHARRDEVGACDGHRYDHYPIGGPALSAPLVLTEVAILRAAQPVLSRVHVGDPALNAFLHAEPEAAHARIEMEAASFLVAIAAALMYLIARGYLTERKAIVLALLFATGTSAYSIAARALWQHTWSLLLITLAIFLLERARVSPSLAAWAGLPVALSYTVRPTNAVVVVVFTAYVAMRHRRQLPWYLLAAAPVATLFFAYNRSVYHAWLSPYEISGGLLVGSAGEFFRPLACNLVSPARGLFVFTPVFLFSVVSLARRSWRSPLAPWLAVLALLHLIAISAYGVVWWAGHVYGPRLLTELTPVFALALIPYLERWTELQRGVRVLFVALALVGLAIHLRGGWSGAVHEWNVQPVNVDDHPERVWGWRDPPFLR